MKDIRIEGIQRTEAGTIFSYLPVKVGDTLTDEKAAQSIKSLFATGFFKDVRIDNDKGVIVVIVEERPAQPRVFGNPSGQVCRLCDGQPGGSDIAFDHNALGGRAAGDHGRSEGCCRERCTEQAASTV